MIASSGIATSINFFFVLVVEVINKPVGCRVDCQFAAVAQCAQAGARHLDGITRGLERPAPVDIDPGLYSDEERQSRGIARLPDSLARSLEAFEQDSVLAQAMGAELARSFVSVRRKELADLGGLELEEEVRILLDRY